MNEREHTDNKYFKRSELECKCGCGETISSELLVRLVIARRKSDTPFVINSGSRCRKHNQAIGSKGSSSHIKGLAVDIAVVGSVQRFEILDSLLTAGFTRLGVASSFIHADIDTTKPPHVMWTYNG